jgi:hypothetical protein
MAAALLPPFTAAAAPLEGPAIDPPPTDVGGLAAGFDVLWAWSFVLTTSKGHVTMEDTRPAHAPAMAEGPNVGMTVERWRSVWSVSWISG